MLTEKQLEAMELYVNGNTITDVAKIVGVSRQTLHQWLKQDEFKNEIDSAIKKVKSEANLKITSKVPTYIQELDKIALTSKSEKIRSDTLMYLVDHVVGKSTTKIETANDTEGKFEDKKELSWFELEKEGILVNMNKKRG